MTLDDIHLTGAATRRQVELDMERRWAKALATITRTPAHTPLYLLANAQLLALEVPP